MNIKPTNSSIQAISAYQNKGSAKAGTSGSSESLSSISVALSAGSQSLHDTEHDVDMEKVQALRESLANGTLKINAERIADGLINSAVELMKR